MREVIKVFTTIEISNLVLRFDVLIAAYLYFEQDYSLLGSYAVGYAESYLPTLIVRWLISFTLSKDLVQNPKTMATAELFPLLGKAAPFAAISKDHPEFAKTFTNFLINRGAMVQYARNRSPENLALLDERVRDAQEHLFKCVVNALKQKILKKITDFKEDETSGSALPSTMAKKTSQLVQYACSKCT